MPPRSLKHIVKRLRAPEMFEATVPKAAALDSTLEGTKVSVAIT
jgi:hypothetical protein